MKTYEVKKDIIATGCGLVDAAGELLGGIVKVGATVSGDPESAPVKKWVDKECLKEQGMAAKVTSKVAHTVAKKVDRSRS